MNIPKGVLPVSAALFAWLLTSTGFADEKPSREETIKYINGILAAADGLPIDASTDTAGKKRLHIEGTNSLSYDSVKKTYRYTLTTARNYVVTKTFSKLTMKDFASIEDCELPGNPSGRLLTIIWPFAGNIRCEDAEFESRLEKWKQDVTNLQDAIRKLFDYSESLEGYDSGDSIQVTLKPAIAHTNLTLEYEYTFVVVSNTRDKREQGYSFPDTHGKPSAHSYANVEIDLAKVAGTTPSREFCPYIIETSSSSGEKPFSQRELITLPQESAIRVEARRDYLDFDFTSRRWKELKKPWYEGDPKQLKYFLTIPVRSAPEFTEARERLVSLATEEPEATTENANKVGMYFPAGDGMNAERLKNAFLHLKEIDSEEKDPFLN